MASNLTESAKIMTGARAIFSINDKPVAYSSNVDGNEEIMYEPIDVLNNLLVQEHAPTGYRVTLNASFFRVPNASLKAAGIFPSASQPVANILKANPMTANIQDANTDAIVAQVEGVKPQTKSFTIQARSVFSEQCSFVAILMRDESDING
jgi:hypothetical protein